MASSEVEMTIEQGESVAARPAGAPNRVGSVAILGKPTEANSALVVAFAGLGHRAWVAPPAVVPELARGDVAIARLDVLPTLDGIEPGLWLLPRLQREGVRVINSPLALLSAHDKLSTALLLGRAGVEQPRTAHVREVAVPAFPGPYVVKPRYGSWGRDVYLCHDEGELRKRLDRIRRRRWFRRHGALVQALVEPTGCDLRVVVAGGKVVGAIERVAMPGEGRTNVALGAVRRPVEASPAARALALRAVAALGIDLAGVDITSDAEGRSYVLEINGAVDFNETYGDNVYEEAAAALLEAAATRSPGPSGQRSLS